MKYLLIAIMSILLVSCQNNYDVNKEIESLNEKLNIGIKDEKAYIELFNAYIINDEFFNAARTIDKSLKNTNGNKINELINNLKDGYDIYDKNNKYYKTILIDYDVNFDPFYKDNSDIDYYKGNSPLIGGNYDSASYISDYLSSNNQKLYKRSNYTIYLLDKDDIITDVYEYTYDVFNKQFENVIENHYKVEYIDDQTVNYINDNGNTECFYNGKIIKQDYIDDNGSTSYKTFEYDENGNLLKVIEYDKEGTTSTEYTRYNNGSPLKVIRYSSLNEDKEFGISARTIKEIYEYAQDGRMLSRAQYFNDEISFKDTFEFDLNNRLIHEISNDYNDSSYNREYSYSYNDEGYLIKKDNLLNADSYTEYIYNDDYSKVTACDVFSNKREGCEHYNLTKEVN